MSTPPGFAPAPGSREPLVEMITRPDGLAGGATAAVRVAATSDRVWQTVEGMWRGAGWVPLVKDIRVEGDRVAVELRLRISVLSIGFRFRARVVREEGRSLELAWIEGEPHGISLRFEIVPDGEASIVYARNTFDVRSLGWLVKLVLKNHPEIQSGIHAGISLTLAEVVRARTLGLPTPGGR